MRSVLIGGALRDNGGVAMDYHAGRAPGAGSFKPLAVERLPRRDPGKRKET